MKDRFRQIIENADDSKFLPQIIALMPNDLDKAATNCEALAVEMMEKFLLWCAKNDCIKRERTHPKHEGKWWSSVICEYFTTRELIAKFLSDYTHNSNRETI